MVLWCYYVYDVKRCRKAGAVLVSEGLAVNETPEEGALEKCRSLGAALV